MRKLTLFTIIILVTLLASTCKKDVKKYTINGVVSDPQLNIKVAGVKVILSGNKVESGVYNTNYVELGSATTDQGGNYTFEIEEENVAGYRFAVLKDKYFDIEEDVSTAVLQASETYTKNFQQYPQSTIQIKIKNASPQGMSDEIKWRFLNADQKCKTCCNSLSVTGTGPSYDQTTECMVVGNRFLVFEWTISKSGSSLYHKDSVFMNCFNTEHFSINY